MKTKIKKVLSALFLYFVSVNISYSYIVHMISPNPCPDFFSYIHHPSFMFQVKFNAQTHDPGDGDTIYYKIFVEQNGNVIQMDGERTGYANEDISVSVNLQNATFICFNEKVVIRVDVRNYNRGVEYSGRGYFVYYKNGLGCTNYSLSDGEIQQINNPGGFWCTFFRTNECCLSSGTYYLKQWKKTFIINGDFSDSIPVLDSGLCLGFNGACPQYQFYTAVEIFRSPTQVKFVAFYYEVISNTIGQYFGYKPCTPNLGTIVYHYEAEPVIQNISLFPLNLNCSNPIGFATCNLLRGSGNLWYDWKDSNTTPHYVQLWNYQQNAKIKVNFVRESENLFTEDRAYYIFARVRNGYSITPWKRLKIRLYADYNTCPNITFTKDSVKIYENAILNNSNDNPGRDIDDFYKLQNPDLPGQSEINFNIEETSTAFTHLDNINLYLAEVNKSQKVSVSKNGEFINYNTETGYNKLKTVLNDNEDISDKLFESDDEDVSLIKGDKLSISLKADNSKYLILDVGYPGVKSKVIAHIQTKKGFKDSVYSRDNQNEICLKIDEPDLGEITIIAAQSFVINKIALVDNLNSAAVNKLKLKNAVHDKYGNVRNELENRNDNGIVTVWKDNKLSLTFENKANSNLNSFYIINPFGRIEDNASENSMLKKKGDNLKSGNKLFDNIPNPFNPITQLTFELSKDAFVKLTVYDVSGREIKTLVNNFTKAGKHSVTFDGSNLSSGVYFYKLETDEFAETKRMILMK